MFSLHNRPSSVSSVSSSVFIVLCLCFNPPYIYPFLSSLSLSVYRCPSLSELIDGTPTLKINHGSGTLVLQLPGNVNVADRTVAQTGREEQQQSKCSPLASDWLLSPVEQRSISTSHLPPIIHLSTFVQVQVLLISSEIILKRQWSC